MTALNEFTRLEASALWRATPGDQRREVLVSLGEATLTISEFSGEVLSHWSLAAVRRANGTTRPAIYHPDSDPGETLEIAADEAAMIDGIDRLLRAIERKRPHPGKLRLATGALAFVTGVAVSVFWLPGALERYASRVVPEVKRVEIGDTLLDHLIRVTGSPCMTRDATSPLRRLADRVSVEGMAPRLFVVPSDVRAAAHLPGNIILLGREVFEDHEDPAVAAGYVVAEQIRAETVDPLIAVLDHAGIVATLRFLTTGTLADEALAGYAETVLIQRSADVDPARLLEGFARIDMPTTPYAYAIDPTGESSAWLIDGDPAHTSDTARAVLSDADWVRLQGICGA